jgi:hypothetical protein
MPDPESWPTWPPGPEVFSSKTTTTSTVVFILPPRCRKQPTSWALHPSSRQLDGRFHTLKVTLAAQGKFTVQARRGYFAEKDSAD